jgi:hypothetical protein
VTTTPTDVDLARLLDAGCVDLFHAARCFRLLHAGTAVAPTRDQLATAITTTQEPHTMTTTRDPGPVWETLCDPHTKVHVPVNGGDPCTCGQQPAAFGLCPHDGRPLAFQHRTGDSLARRLRSGSRVVCLTCGEEPTP